MKIEIEEAVDNGGEPIWAYAEGHHEPEDFLRALYEYCDAYEDSELTDKMVKHKYWRDIKAEDGDYREYIFVECEETHEDAYPVTMIEVQ